MRIEWRMHSNSDWIYACKGNRMRVQWGSEASLKRNPLLNSETRRLAISETDSRERERERERESVIFFARVSRWPVFLLSLWDDTLKENSPPRREYRYTAAALSPIRWLRTRTKLIALWRLHDEAEFFFFLWNFFLLQSLNSLVATQCCSIYWVINSFGHIDSFLGEKWLNTLNLIEHISALFCARVNEFII